MLKLLILPIEKVYMTQWLNKSKQYSEYSEEYTYSEN